jgi:hypothetical protein
LRWRVALAARAADQASMPPRPPVGLLYRKGLLRFAAQEYVGRRTVHEYSAGLLNGRPCLLNMFGFELFRAVSRADNTERLKHATAPLSQAGARSVSQPPAPEAEPLPVMAEPCALKAKGASAKSATACRINIALRCSAVPWRQRICERDLLKSRRDALRRRVKGAVRALAASRDTWNHRFRATGFTYLRECT